MIENDNLHWINVNDRLPEQHYDFIDLFDDSGLFITCQQCLKSDKVIVAVTDYDGRRFVDCDFVQDGRWSKLYNKVTHWMPLPSCPKE